MLSQPEKEALDKVYPDEFSEEMQVMLVMISRIAGVDPNKAIAVTRNVINDYNEWVTER